MYADYEFYTNVFLGNILTAETADRWLERASDEIDSITFNRLMDGLPDDEKYQIRIKKAVCAVAETMYQVDALRQATAASADENGTMRGPVSSISSGKESISFASSASAFSSMASSTESETASVEIIARRYLRGVPGADGVLLLYAGKEGSYAR